MDNHRKRKKFSKSEVKTIKKQNKNNDTRYLKKLKSVNSNESKVANGLVLADKYIPEELLIELLCYIDRDTLLACQVVCKYWQNLIQSYVWHRKSELIVGQSLVFDKRIPWMIYCCLCTKMPFKKNLMENHSGEDGVTMKWELPPLRGNNWSVESPPVPQLPNDDSLSKKEYCFVTSSGMTWKYQIIDLINAGFSSYLLDHLQPPIKISEWYCCLNAPAKYICDIELLKDNGKKKCIFYRENEDSHWKTVGDHYTFSNIMENEKQNIWFKYEHEFTNYGRGLRKIKFIHGGRYIQRLGNDGHNEYGCKMARACIKIELPTLDYDKLLRLPNYY